MPDDEKEEQPKEEEAPKTEEPEVLVDLPKPLLGNIIDVARIDAERR